MTTPNRLSALDMHPAPADFVRMQAGTTAAYHCPDDTVHGTAQMLQSYATRCGAKVTTQTFVGIDNGTLETTRFLLCTVVKAGRARNGEE